MQVIGRYIARALVFFSSLLLFTSCGISLKKVKESEKQGLYYEAANGYISLYRKAGRKEKDKRALFSNGAARNFLAMGQYAKAYNYFIRAKSLGCQDSLLSLNLGKTSQAIGKYKDAENYYNDYIKTDSANFFSRLGIQSCQLALSDSLPSRAKGFIVKKLPYWNSSKCDFAPFISSDGNTIFFTSNRGVVPKEELSKITGTKDNDIYSVSRDADGEFSKRADTISGFVNTLADEGTSSLSNDGLTMYYCKADTTGLIGLYTAHKDRDNKWQDGSRLYLFADSNYIIAHPSISPRGDKLAFVSNAKGSFGDMDIYICDIVGDKFSKPYNLGRSINTKGKECYPYLASDSLLYFSSNGHIGYGGLDIFKAVLLPSGNWSVSNMGKPINSSYDDYSISFFNPEVLKKSDDFRQKGYFASTRDDARGYPHLYSFELPNINTIIEGYVMDREHYAIEGARVRIIGYRTGDASVNANEVTTGQDGHFQMKISGDVDYIMLASAKGYLNQYVRFRTDSLGYDATYSVDFVLSSRDKAEVIRNIYYDFDSASLRDESKPALDSLVDIMQQNPEVKITISSYADRFGSDAYNINLSEDRAKSVVDYLVSKGIDAGRLDSKGYGKSVPFVVTPAISKKYNFLKTSDILTDEFISKLNKEEQDICDALNRRTEFRVNN